MNQQKIGEFLKQLRKEKNLTQEQLAETLNVSGRTVSRWETGSNMPDLSLLVELADYYDIDIREIFNGERKSENMENETKSTKETNETKVTKETKVTTDTNEAKDANETTGTNESTGTNEAKDTKDMKVTKKTNDTKDTKVTKDILTQVAEYSNEEKKNLKKKMIDISLSAALLLVFSVVLNKTNGFGGYIAECPIQNMTDFATGLALAILIIYALYLSGILEKAKKWGCTILKITGRKDG